MRIAVEPNDNPKEREDRHGRVRVSHRRTWCVVDLDSSEFYGEYDRKRDATVAANRIKKTKS